MLLRMAIPNAGVNSRALRRVWEDWTLTICRGKGQHECQTVSSSGAPIRLWSKK